MKREIIIELERVTIISNHSPKTSTVKADLEGFIEVEAIEIKNNKNTGLPPKNSGDQNNEKQI